MIPALITLKSQVVLAFGLCCLSALISCSSGKRPSEKIGQDSGTDTETDSDTGLVWIPGNDFDLTEPFILHEYKANNGPCQSLSFDGENLALSWSMGIMDIDDQVSHVFLFVFPWDMPWNAQHGMFPEEPPACRLVTWNAPASKPFPTEEGFFLITTGSTSDYEFGCQVVLSEWDLGASISYGPQAYYNLYPDELYNAMNPTGPQDSTGCVTAGNVKCKDCDDPILAELVYQIYRYCPGDPPQLVLGQNYPWNDHVLDTGHVFSNFGGTNTFEWSGVLTTVVVSKWGHLILAQGTHNGDVIMEPQIVMQPFDPTNSNSPQTGYRFYSQHDGSFLVISSLHYNEDGDQNTDPYPLELVSHILSMDGQVLSGPTPLVAYEGISAATSDNDMAAWNGLYFGACYRDPLDTYKFMLLDEDGVLLRDPVSLFAPIPNPVGRMSSCDIVAIDDEIFAVAISVASEGQQDYQDGMYIVYVNINPIE